LDLVDERGEIIPDPIMAAGMATSASVASDSKTRVYCFSNDRPPKEWENIRPVLRDLHSLDLMVIEVQHGTNYSKEWDMVTIVMDEIHAHILKCGLETTGEYQVFWNPYIPTQIAQQCEMYFPKIMTGINKDGTRIMRRMPDTSAWYRLGDRLYKARNLPLWQSIVQKCVILHILDRTCNRILNRTAMFDRILVLVRDREKYVKKTRSKGKRFYLPGKKILAEEKRQTRVTQVQMEQLNWELYSDDHLMTMDETVVVGSIPAGPPLEPHLENDGKKIEEETPRGIKAEESTSGASRSTSPSEPQQQLSHVTEEPIPPTTPSVTNETAVVPAPASQSAVITLSSIASATATATEEVPTESNPHDIAKQMADLHGQHAIDTNATEIKTALPTNDLNRNRSLVVRNGRSATLPVPLTDEQLPSQSNGHHRRAGSNGTAVNIPPLSLGQLQTIPRSTTKVVRRSSVPTTMMTMEDDRFGNNF
jgi:hypothetical protein